MTAVNSFAFVAHSRGSENATEVDSITSRSFLTHLSYTSAEIPLRTPRIVPFLRSRRSRDRVGPSSISSNLPISVRTGRDIRQTKLIRVHRQDTYLRSASFVICCPVTHLVAPGRHLAVDGRLFAVPHRLGFSKSRLTAETAAGRTRLCIADLRPSPLAGRWAALSPSREY